MKLDNHQQLYHKFVESYIDQQYLIEKGSPEIILQHIS